MQQCRDLVWFEHEVEYVPAVHFDIDLNRYSVPIVVKTMLPRGRFDCRYLQQLQLPQVHLAFFQE